jgi:tRNA pseudouridine38-40 synthase
MRALRLVIAYDGTEFHGWQVQDGPRTVQGEVESALRVVLDESDVTIEGAGRTDTGVHARGQVASFRTRASLPARALPPLLNRRLPADVRVRGCDECDLDFSARRSARARRYSYQLLDRDDPLLGRYGWHPPRAVPHDGLERATRVLEGEHDCSAFQSSGGSPTRPECRILRARWASGAPGPRLDIIADHFLYHMVRTVVGTALALASAPDPGAAMTAVLRSRDRRRAGVTAPPQGLCLEEVFYDGGTS